ncbi:MAG: dephospho-CoA kinase [Lachnospiraceae bacterium]|jgi:dephospho-CoA kinase|nr:dephospho-CoA kinase [Lachnospiraceae bacterium]
MYSIGITGGIGAGKTMALTYVKEHYPCEIYIADEVAHKVMEPGQPCYERIVELMGKGILAKDRTIDKIAMAARIFMDKNLLNRVNAIVHPAVQEYLTQCLTQGKAKPELAFVFVEAALLIEAGYTDKMDELWYIHAEEFVRRKRLEAQRGYSPDRITQVIRQQLTEEAFRKECHVVLENNGTPEELYKQIDQRLEVITWNSCIH